MVALYADAVQPQPVGSSPPPDTSKPAAAEHAAGGITPAPAWLGGVVLAVLVLGLVWLGVYPAPLIWVIQQMISTVV